MSVGRLTPPENISKVYGKYWLSPSGEAYEVEDHLSGARRAQEDSDEFDSRKKWGYEDMRKRGWLRVETEKGMVVGDGLPNARQSVWLRDAKIFLTKKTGEEFTVKSGLVATAVPPISDKNRSHELDRKLMPSFYSGRLGDSIPFVSLMSLSESFQKFKSALDSSDIPSDVIFYTDGKDRCTIYFGDWHEKETWDKACDLASKHFKNFEKPDDSEIGRPEWATSKIRSGKKE